MSDAFTFDRNYHNLEQVVEWLPAFNAIRKELADAGQYPYNDSFKGRIPGVAGPCEDTAIYLLQNLYRARENALRVAAALAEGFEPIEHVEHVEKFSGVIVYDDQDRMRGPIWQEWQDARLVPDEVGSPRAAATGGIRAVLPRGRRAYGTLINGRKVMVRR